MQNQEQPTPLTPEQQRQQIDAFLDSIIRPVVMVMLNGMRGSIPQADAGVVMLKMIGHIGRGYSEATHIGAMTDVFRFRQVVLDEFRKALASVPPVMPAQGSQVRQ